MHTHLIAIALRNNGFDVKVYSNGVMVSLNRYLYISEVETALDNIFEGITFNLSRYGNSVLVQE